MKPTFQADADLDQRIVAGLMRLEPSIDFQTAHEARLKSVPDDEVLALCAHTGRILVSHDQKTMPAHFATFIASQESPGVIIVPHHMPVGEAVRELYLAWTASEAAEWRNRILRLPL